MVMLAGENAKLLIATTGPRIGVAVGVAESTGVEEEVAVALGNPVTLAVGEGTGVEVEVAEAVNDGIPVADAVREAVADGMGVTVASTTTIVPVMPDDALDRYA